MRVTIVTLLAATAVVVAGCGAVGHLSDSAGSAVRGKALFMSGTSPSCSSCHTLAAAGAKGTIGPDLDGAFGPDRCQGFKESTIRDVVRGQIAYPDTNPGTGAVGMPANLATGQDAKDISAYVASVAGVTGKQGTATPYWNCTSGVEVTSSAS